MPKVRITDKDIAELTEDIHPEHRVRCVNVAWMDGSSLIGYLATRIGDGMFHVYCTMGGGRAWISDRMLKGMLQQATSISWPEHHRLHEPAPTNREAG